MKIFPKEGINIYYGKKLLKKIRNNLFSFHIKYSHPSRIFLNTCDFKMLFKMETRKEINCIFFHFPCYFIPSYQIP